MPQKDADRFHLHLPDGWRAEIKRIAKAQDRSMNWIITDAVQTYLRLNGVELTKDRGE